MRNENSKELENDSILTVVVYYSNNILRSCHVVLFHQFLSNSHLVGIMYQATVVDFIIRESYENHQMPMGTGKKAFLRHHSDFLCKLGSSCRPSLLHGTC